MRISPLDVRSQEFKKALRGYDAEEVKAFLDAIADTMEDLLKEKENAEAELVGLKKKVETFTEMEMSLRDAMVAAQKAADEAKMNARRNAELMIREAELEVRQRIAEAKRQVDDVFKARETVRAEMRAFLPRLRSLLESQLTYLENIEQEVTSMDPVDGDPAEAEEVRSFTATLESRAQEAEGKDRDEIIRREERAVERRKQIAGEQPAAAAAGDEPRSEETGQPANDPLDVAMHEHHEKQAGWQDRPEEQPPQAGAHEGAHTGQHSEGSHSQQHSEGGHTEPRHEGGSGEPYHGGATESDRAGQQSESAHAGQHQEQHHGDGRAPERATAPPASAEFSPWRPDPAGGAPESDKELRISHAPQQDGDPEKHEDANA